MRPESTFMQRARSRIADHPRLVIMLLAVVFLGPFVSKAVHMDDPLFVWSAEWIRSHPIDFYGCTVNWSGVVHPMSLANCNPPLMSYFLLPAGWLSGWNEIALHGSCLLLAFAAGAGVYELARAWSSRPLLASMVAMLCPVFLVSGTTIMCDMLMLALLVWAVVFWESGLARGSAPRLLWAGGLFGLAILAKYSAVAYLPVLLVLALSRERKLGWWVAGFVLPLLFLAAFEWATSRMYELGLFRLASNYASTMISERDGHVVPVLVSGLAFVGGSLLVSLFFAPFMWPRTRTVLMGFLLFLVLAAAVLFTGELDWAGNWSLQLQCLLLLGAALHLFSMTLAETFEKRDRVSIAIAVWLFTGAGFAIAFNWTLSARSLLPLIPPLSILVARRVEHHSRLATADPRLLLALIPCGLIAVGLALADYRNANGNRAAAQIIMAKFGSGTVPVWFQGHWGFQYYMQKFGAQPLDFERTAIEPGAILVVPQSNCALALPNQEDAALIETVTIEAFPGLSVMNGSTGAGFYGATGPLPFVVGPVPPLQFFVFKFMRPAEFLSRLPWNRELYAGKSIVADVRSRMQAAGMDPLSVGAEGHMRLGIWLKDRGKTAQAIRHFRFAERVVPDDPRILIRLAWALATEPRADLRDGVEALQFAAESVALTRNRDAVALGTLAAAYAETGRFNEAIQAAEAAAELAPMSKNREIVSWTRKLLELHRAGKTVCDVPNLTLP